jgi:DNA-binding response OmpR family regulator
LTIAVFDPGVALTRRRRITSQRSRRLLIVSDHPTRGALLARLTAAAGYDVAVSGDVASGLAIAVTEPPETVLVDLADGNTNDAVRLLDLIRSSRRQALATTVVVVLTERRGPFGLAELVSGADTIVPLPFHVHDLIEEFSRLERVHAEARAQERRNRTVRLAQRNLEVDLRDSRLATA